MAKFGFDKLREQVLDFVDAEWQFIKEEAAGDTPIEKLLFAALRSTFLVGSTELAWLEVVPNIEVLATRQEEMKKEKKAKLNLLCVPQAQIGDRRVDFLFVSFVPSYPLDTENWTEPVWRKLVIECDGHDFHERTKEQASRDKSRDRSFVLEGYDCFRFTGSEIWKDPLGCADQITEWVMNGWINGH